MINELHTSPSSFKAVRLTDNVFWVGAIDWTTRNFHGYYTSRGTTYNAYLIISEKITLIDTVKSPFKEEMFARITSVIDPKAIRYIISNHAEPDHTGALAWTIEKVHPEKIFASKMGAKALNAHYGMDEITTVEDNIELDIGGLTLSFINTPMLHWPDSMFSFLKEEHLLFSQDAFGMHLASGKRFADQIDEYIISEEAAKYYANILMPYSSIVSKLIEKLSSSGIKFNIIAPDHGPIYRKNKDIDWIIKQYSSWALNKPKTKAVIVYDTMWQSTELMARAIAEGINISKVTPLLYPMGSSHRSDVAAALLDAGALIVGSPTLNNNIFPSVADLLTYIKGLKPTNLIGTAFGSYGWSGEATNQIKQTLEEMHVNIITDPIKVKYVPKDNDLISCQRLGCSLGEHLAKGETNND